MSEHTEINLERFPDDGPLDETDVSLRAYFAEESLEHLQEYDRSWSDEQVMKWDGNFRNDGTLMLVCCERDVEMDEYRQILEKHLAVRGR